MGKVYPAGGYTTHEVETSVNITRNLQVTLTSSIVNIRTEKKVLFYFCHK
jgi:hypothetical protein